ERPIQQYVGQKRQGARHGGQVRDGQEIGQRNAQELALHEAPKHEGRVVRRVHVDQPRQVLLEVHARARAARQSARRKGLQIFRVLDQQGGEIRTEAGQGQEV